MRPLRSSDDANRLFLVVTWVMAIVLMVMGIGLTADAYILACLLFLTAIVVLA